MKQLPIIQDTKKIFWKKGACSHTLFHLINRYYENNNPAEERAADPLAGGILQKGHQCGMLWGAALAIGKEAYFRSDTSDEAIAMTMNATRNVMDSFQADAESILCTDITDCDFNNRWSSTKYFLSGRFLKCFNLAEDWVPKAIATIEESFDEKIDPSDNLKSCSAEVLKKMGALEEEIVMVSGFTGGLGLSGEACGALAASIWYATLLDILDKPTKSAHKNPKAVQKYEEFIKYTEGKIKCKDICGKKFTTLSDHSTYINNDGCAHIIDLLAE
jgi:hypothetical protein